MGFLLGGNSTASGVEKYAGIQVSTSLYGHCKPLLYGTRRISAYLVDYDDFTAIEQTQSYGKGGSITTGYDYKASVIMAICEGGAGGIGGILRVWQSNDCNNLSYYGLTFLSGARPQSPWATWVSEHPAKALAYSGTALICKQNVDLGGSAAPPDFNYEAIGLLATEQDPNWTQAVANAKGIPWGGACFDALPYAVVLDFLTNSYYGAGFTASRIADLVTGNSSYATYCKAAGFVISPSFDEQQNAAEHIDDIMAATNSTVVMHSASTGMVLNVVPYGDSPITANGANFTPNTTPLYDLGPDDFLGVIGEDGKPTGSDPVQITRTSTQDVKNDVPVEYCDRANNYAQTPVDSPCTEDAMVNGFKQDSSQSMTMITRASHALQISQLLALRNVYVRNTYTFKVGWKYELLEPMDLVTLTDPITGLSKKVVRIVSIEFPDEEQENSGFEVTAEEWPFGVGAATLYNTQSAQGASTSMTTAPASITPIIFEPPALLSESGGNEIWLGTAGTPTLWGGANVWVSIDGGSSYGAAPVGKISGSARMGVLSASLAVGSPSDTTDTLSVDLSSSCGVLSGASATAMNAFVTACYVDGEIVAYQNATLTGQYNYNLTTMRRGGYGSTIGNHAAGSRFLFLDDAVFKLPYDASLVGKTIYVKLQSFNGVGGGLQDLSTCTAYSYTPTGQGYPAPPVVAITQSATNSSGSGSTATAADGVTLTSSGATATAKVWLTVSWSWPANYPTPIGFQVVAFSGTDPTNAANYLFPVATVDPSTRSYTAAVTPTAAIPTVNAVVRAIYA